MYDTNMTGMQQQAQAALPVIPNNGNPRGVYNMPQAGRASGATAPVVPQAKVDKYAWLQPSQSMQNVRAMSQRIQQNVDTSKSKQFAGLTDPNVPTLPGAQKPATGLYDKPAPVVEDAPIIPQAVTQPPVLPQRVMPQGDTGVASRVVVPNRLVRQQVA